MTPAQLATLKADILATPSFNGLGSYYVAEAYNVVAVPSFTVWRTDVPLDEVMRNGMDWTRVDNLSVGKSRIWDWLTRLGTINAAQPNIRAGIDATWTGTAADLAVRAAVYTHCKRGATRGERLFATGTGSVADPGTMTFEGAVTSDDVQQARELA